MRSKLLALLAVAIIAGCADEEPKGPAIPPEETAQFYNSREFKTRTYKGHRYVVVEGVSGNYGVAILHDPDCPCRKSLPTQGEQGAEGQG